MELDCYHQKLIVPVTSRLTELWILENEEILGKSQRHSLVPGPFSKNINLIITQET